MALCSSRVEQRLVMTGRGTGETGSERRESAGMTASIVQQHVERLLTCVQPNTQSDVRRNAVAAYVCDLVKRCFNRRGQRLDVDTFMFGSVPLRTYLPDGDVDISIFAPVYGDSRDALREDWAIQLKTFLEEEGRRGTRGKRGGLPSSTRLGLEIQDCQIIQAEVKIVKCVVSGLVVDISFNALGGLCAVAFLEWFDSTIGRSHLLKKSIVLVKAWCYYESRLLGAHHGLLSSYALETMVLFVLNIYGEELASPLEVFHRFLQVFADFDFDKYCLSMIGPIPLSSFPMPHVDEQRMPPGSPHLSAKALRDAVLQFSARPREAAAAVECLSSDLSCSSSQRPSIPLVKKHLNIMDPLFPSNNLGRSVSKSSYMRMKAAFSHGSKTLTRVLEQDPTAAGQTISAFFSSTWSCTHRMVVENRVFSSIMGQAPREQIMTPSHQAVHGPYHQKGTSVDYSRVRPVAMVRGHSSSLSLPDLSVTRDSSKDKDIGVSIGADDSMEAHAGRSISPVRLQQAGDEQAGGEKETSTVSVGAFDTEKSMLLPLDQVQMMHKRSISEDCNGGSHKQMTTEKDSGSSSGPAVVHRRSGSSTSHISLSGQHVVQLSSQMQTLNFLRSGIGTTSVNDSYTSDMKTIMENISVARRYQPAIPGDQSLSQPFQKVASSENVDGGCENVHDGQKFQAGHADDSSNRTIVQQDASKQDGATIDKIDLPRVKVEASTAGITYASVTAQGLTPRAHSRPLSRRGSMSVNASISPVSSNSTSPEKPSANVVQESVKKTAGLTSEMIQNHLDETTSKSTALQQQPRDSALDQKPESESTSSCARVKTWSLVAQRPRSALASPRRASTDSLIKLDSKSGTQASSPVQETQSKDDKNKSESRKKEGTWATVLSRTTSPR